MLTLISRNQLICANTGDSRAILCSYMNNRWMVKNLSRDHKPEDSHEAQRVRKNGGRIEQSRKTRDSDEFYGPMRVWLKEL